MLTTHMTRPLRNGLGMILLDLCEAGPGKPWSVYAIVARSSRSSAAAVTGDSLFRSLTLKALDMLPRLPHRSLGVGERLVSLLLCRLSAEDSLTSRRNRRVLGVAVEEPAAMRVRAVRGCRCVGCMIW